MKHQLKLNGGHILDEILIRPGVLESHFPVYSGGAVAADGDQPETPAIVAPASPSPSPMSNGGGKRPDVVGGRVRKRLSSEEFVFTRTEDLSHLVQIGDRSGYGHIHGHGSPSNRKQRRGCCVYPAGNNIRIGGADVDAVAPALASGPTATASPSPRPLANFPALESLRRRRQKQRQRQRPQLL